MQLRTKHIIYTLFGVCCILFFFRLFTQYIGNTESRELERARNNAVSSIIESRTASRATTSSLFATTDVVRILFIGLDTRAGESVSHCDAIQLLEIDRAKAHIAITAVPRGTYAHLPPGTAATSSDYYVSNSCALGGLDYGIQQIERILGTEADYVAFIGFSELVGALRALRLPTTETIQWLRHRQGYAIGEPQRARNHSTFIKSLITKYTPTSIQKKDIVLAYILYTFIDTDLTFEEIQVLMQTLVDMDVVSHKERITLAMKPAYAVQDIAYDPDTAGSYVADMIEPISNWLSKEDYQELSKEDISQTVQSLIAEKKEDPSFISWAYDHTLWNQIYEETDRLEAQYTIIESYTDTVTSTSDLQTIWSNYVLEMEYFEYTDWAQKGREAIAKHL